VPASRSSGRPLTRIASGDGDDLTEPEPLVDRREVGLQPLDQRQGAIADRTHPRLAHDTVAERLDRRFEIGLFTLDNRHIRLAPRERLLDHVSVRVGRAKFSERPVGADVSHRPLGLADNSGEPRGVVAAAKADDVAGGGRRRSRQSFPLRQ